MKVLVTGATGQLGFDVCRVLKNCGIENIGIGSAQCDITDDHQVQKLFTREKPDAVVHCAAYTKVDQAEEEPEKCMAVNYNGTKNIAKACKSIGAKLLYISTDYVFPGVGTCFYEPDDAANPKNIYGKSKLAGETAVKELMDRFFIVRISWVFGINGNNFIKTMLRLSESRKEVGVVCDQIGSPTYTADLAPLLCDMIKTEKFGVYHATNEGVCSWAELAEAVFQFAEKDMSVKYLTTANYPTKAVRPLNSRLSKACLDAAGFSHLPHWTDAVERYLMQLNEQSPLKNLR